ncbi:hypothetical protein BH769_gp44 [Gordonia phage BritBrat]|uniref:Uncharacterized protein n=1 Tax=Gordonia phage BritBrat TaxID=1838064 RepID=A0A166XZP7_9CAUD|nr:hypothetical protein BH769_gp44 [Gordonia phage BritBrat]ANA85250.1 hypothetical protein PBI_BRITBRAT_44 [Gordonia phage BritBrat]
MNDTSIAASFSNMFPGYRLEPFWGVHQLLWTNALQTADGHKDILIATVYDPSALMFWVEVAAEQCPQPLGEDRIHRLSAIVRKLAGRAGFDIADLIEEGHLEEGDLA